MQNYLSKKAVGISPYTAGAQPKEKNIIKLNTNENPYPPSPKTLQAYENFDAKKLRLYPRPDGGELRKTIAEIFKLHESYVFCGNGSDEVLGFAYDAFFDKDIMFPNITYSFFPVWADLFDITYNLLPLNANFTIPIDKLKAPGGIVLANPNAPTGIALSLDDVQKVLKNNKDCVVIVDEAYGAFGAQSAAPLVPEYENLLIVNTLSKSHSLAGLRIGYALGQPHLIDGLVRIKDSFNSYPIDSIAQCVAAAALRDKEYYSGIAKKIMATRESTKKRLEDLGYSVLPSCSNFLFVTHKSKKAADIKKYLEENKIFVRHFNAPLISDYLRISIGTDEQMDTLIQKLTKFEG